MQTLNGLTIEVYSSGTTLIADPGGVLAYADNLRFKTGFPGGLYLDGSFFVTRELRDYWAVRGAQRVVVRNGQKIVYEGKIDNLEGHASGDAEGTQIRVTGPWGAIAMRYKIRKRWTDQRITDDVWVWDETASGAELCTFDRNNRLRFTPKNEAWATNNAASIIYTMPTGQAIKKITYDYDLQESTYNYYLRFYDATNGASTIVAATGTGSSQTYTPATPVQSMYIQYISQANQTPVSDGTIYGELSNVTVYGETSTINAYEVSLDVQGACGELSTDTTYNELGSATLPTLDRFLFDDFTDLADILAAAAEYGDTSQSSIAFSLIASELGTTNNGEPVLKAALYPALSTVNYVVRLSGQNVIDDNIDRDYSQIANWIAVQYTDERLEEQMITPDDGGYSGLTDATSVANYGRRVYQLNLGHATAAMAYSNGQRYLAKWKDPQWKGSITVMGYILGSGGNEIPASEIEAGKVMEISDYIVSEVLATEAYDAPRVIVTSTSYDDENETCTISFGPLDDLVMQEAYFLPVYDEPAANVNSTASGPGKLNWKRQYGLSPGTKDWEEAVKLGKKRWLEKHPKAKRVRKN